MKILYYDCFCGISGDKNLGALIDLGVDQAYLINELSKLNLTSEYEIKIEKALKNGISGTNVYVILKSTQNIENGHDCEMNSKHNMEEDNKQINQHSKGLGIREHMNHEVQNEKIFGMQGKLFRNIDDIKNIINNSLLKDKIKKLSIDIFMKVAEAEALIHNKPLNEIHFHEAGAIDSIVDIVGAAICLDFLNVDRIMASPVELGGGFVKCAHGIMPVPAPATVHILKNIPVKTGAVEFEATTPTGAAILTVIAKEFTDKLDFSIDKIGYGIGKNNFDTPDLLRVYLGRTDEV